MSGIRIRLLGIAMLSVFNLTLAVASAAHPYHASYAEVEWNAKTGNFEVALCVWPADLEKAVSLHQKRVVNLDNEENIDSLFAEYVKKRFSIRSLASDQTESEIRWVGHQRDRKRTWLYFEIVGSEVPSEWSIENRTFFELNEEQINQVQFKAGSNMESFALNAKQPVLEVQTARPTQPSHR